MQAALKWLGHALPAEETDAKRFGDETQKAVMAVQRDEALASDGIVDYRTDVTIILLRLDGRDSPGGPAWLSILR